MRYNVAGKPVGTLPLTPDLRSVEFMARQGSIRGVPHDAQGGFVLGFRYSGTIERFGANKLEWATEGIEPVLLPSVLKWRVPGGAVVQRVSPAAVVSSLGLSILSDTVFVHFAGRSSYANRLVDRYRLQDGEYLGSTLLPMPVARVIRTPRGYIATTTGMRPSLLLLGTSAVRRDRATHYAADVVPHSQQDPHRAYTPSTSHR
jgi:hypothetical protein